MAVVVRGYRRQAQGRADPGSRHESSRVIGAPRQQAIEEHPSGGGPVRLLQELPSGQVDDAGSGAELRGSGVVGEGGVPCVFVMVDLAALDIERGIRGSAAMRWLASANCSQVGGWAFAAGDKAIGASIARIWIVRRALFEIIKVTSGGICNSA